MSTSRTRAIALAATAGIAAAALAGCGSSSDPASTAAGDSTTPTITVKRDAALPDGIGVTDIKAYRTEDYARPCQELLRSRGS